MKTERRPLLAGLVVVLLTVLIAAVPPALAEPRDAVAIFGVS